MRIQTDFTCGEINVIVKKSREKRRKEKEKKNFTTDPRGDEYACACVRERRRRKRSKLCFFCLS